MSLSGAVISVTVDPFPSAQPGDDPNQVSIRVNVELSQTIVAGGGTFNEGAFNLPILPTMTESEIQSMIADQAAVYVNGQINGSGFDDFTAADVRRFYL